MEKIKQIVNFLFELNELKRTPRNGWHRTGIKDSESVAEHTAVCAQMAYIIALMEGADAEHSATLALFHDIGEAREGDQDWVTRIYRETGNKEKASLAQIDGLPMASAFADNILEMKERKTKEAIIAKDADALELALQARIYEQSGYQSARLFIDGMRGNLKTASAKKLLAQIEKSNIEDWWLAIPEIAAAAEKIFRNKTK